MELVRLTSRNAHNYIGKNILFKTRDQFIVKRILGATKTCVRIDHPDLNNCLETISRRIFVILE